MTLLIETQIIPIELSENPLRLTRDKVAEHTRPARALKPSILKAKRKPQGRKQVHEKENTVYTNWHAPLVWPKIVEAARDPYVGWKMSARRIRDVLIKTDRDLFGHIARSTIDGWIDRTGSKPRWSDAALQMADKGYVQGHSTGGRRGVLVCTPFEFGTIACKADAHQDTAS